MTKQTARMPEMVPFAFTKPPPITSNVQPNIAVAMFSINSHVLEPSCVSSFLGFTPALLAVAPAVDRLLLVFFGDLSSRTPSDSCDLSYALIGVFLFLIFSSDQDPSRLSSCIEGMMRSGSALAPVDVRGNLLCGDPDETKDRFDVFDASIRVGLAAFETVQPDIICVSDSSSSPSLSTTHDSDNFGFALS